MANNTGYEFFIDGLVLPFAPPELKIKVGSNNKTISLINQGDINILKSPALVEVEFEVPVKYVDGNAQETAGDAWLDPGESLSLGYIFRSPSHKANS